MYTTPITYEFTASDIAEMREAYGNTEPGCSEIVMLSNGYAEVWDDGEVTQHGRIVFHLES